MDLELEPTIDRWPVMLHSVGEKKKSFLVVGSSHSSRTAEALKRAGYLVDTIFKNNWRALKNSVKDLASDLANEINVKLEEKKTDVVVLQLLDSNIYWALQEDGSTISARFGPDQKYHMDGYLITISKSAQHSLFNTLCPIFEVVNKDFLLLTPLPRYIIGGCCGDKDHMDNRQHEGFEQQLMTDLRELASNFKDFLFTSGYKNGKIVDPQVSLRGMKKEEIWDSDTVHPRDVAYDKIAEGVVKVASNLEDAGKKRRRTDSLDGQRPPQMASTVGNHGRSVQGGTGGGVCGGVCGGGGGRPPGHFQQRRY
jgi:lysophospholipase L1-like esterase